jgi:hypothetical protein
MASHVTHYSQCGADINRDLYEMYVAEMSDRVDYSERILKRNTFKRVWKKNFSKRSHKDFGTKWVKLTNAEAGKCHVCMQAQVDIRQGTAAQRSRAKENYRDHLKFVAAERQAYAHNRERAARGEVISIGADATSSFATVCFGYFACC